MDAILPGCGPCTLKRTLRKLNRSLTLAGIQYKSTDFRSSYPVSNKFKRRVQNVSQMMSNVGAEEDYGYSNGMLYFCWHLFISLCHSIIALYDKLLCNFSHFLIHELLSKLLFLYGLFELVHLDKKSCWCRASVFSCKLKIWWLFAFFPFSRYIYSIFCLIIILPQLLSSLLWCM